MSELDRRHRMIGATATKGEDRRARADALERGRAAYGLRSWTTAYELLSRADEAATLGGGDLELLARSAYLSGRAHRFLPPLERAYRAHVAAGDMARAVRCAHWLGLFFLFQGKLARATGWLSRARRLLGRSGLDCVEAGYLITLELQLAAYDLETAHALAERAAGIGERFADADLVACARHLQGRALVLAGRAEAGLSLLDEAMTAVIAGEVSPLVSGLLYCSVIEVCLLVFAFGRAREWTSALAEWCAGQPELFAFTGTCRVHRAAILKEQGAWREAIEEAGRARELGARGGGQQVSAAACYQEGEVHRLRGELAAAEDAYRRASQLGREPQPGMALLRMAQGRRRAAAAAMRRVVNATTDRLRRIELLSAHVEIMLASGEVEEARRACAELEDAARCLACGGALDALAAQARGAVQLAEGEAQAALASLRAAGQRWQQIEAPYAAARLRVLAGLACRALGDLDGAKLELDAARAVFAQLGATSDLARLDRLARPSCSGPARGLTDRELQVLRLIAAGMTNRAIADELSRSEKTVERHVSNIFVKLDVSSRAAATAYGYEHQLI
jgi:DNA-binding NarL/FixJ family response regulator